MSYNATSIILHPHLIALSALSDVQFENWRIPFLRWRLKRFEVTFLRSLVNPLSFNQSSSTCSKVGVCVQSQSAAKDGQKKMINDEDIWNEFSVTCSNFPRVPLTWSPTRSPFA